MQVEGKLAWEQGGAGRPRGRRSNPDCGSRRTPPDTHPAGCSARSSACIRRLETAPCCRFCPCCMWACETCTKMKPWTASCRRVALLYGLHAAHGCQACFAQRCVHSTSRPAQRRGYPATSDQQVATCNAFWSSFHRRGNIVILLPTLCTGVCRSRRLQRRAAANSGGCRACAACRARRSGDSSSGRRQRAGWPAGRPAKRQPV